MSDFSLMDAIECGIVKLPRVPVADNIPGDEMPMFRNLWEHIRPEDAEEGPRQGRQRSIRSDLPPQLQTALEALYGHYEKTFELWARSRISRSAVLHRRLQQHLDLQARLRLHLRLPAPERRRHDQRWRSASLALFQNYDEHGNPLAAPEHAADRQRAARIRRSAGRQLPRDGRRRDRALPARDRRAHRRLPRRPRTSPTRTCCAK